MDAAITADSGQLGRDSGPKTLPALTHVPGGWPIWVGIFSEMTEFAMMFIIYFIAKAHYPELFNDGPTKLNTLAGVLNTLVLLTSSYCVAKSMQAIRRDDTTACVRWLWLAIIAGGTYLLIKTWEYHWNETMGISKDTNTFFTVYYYTTFNHMLHVGWGSAAVLWAIFGVKRGSFTAQSHGGLEAVAVYWHMIDLAWIVIFPLLYVLR